MKTSTTTVTWAAVRLLHIWRECKMKKWSGGKTLTKYHIYCEQIARVSLISLLSYYSYYYCRLRRCCRCRCLYTNGETHNKKLSFVRMHFSFKIGRVLFGSVQLCPVIFRSSLDSDERGKVKTRKTVRISQKQANAGAKREIKRCALVFSCL